MSKKTRRKKQKLNINVNNPDVVIEKKKSHHINDSIKNIRTKEKYEGNNKILKHYFENYKTFFLIPLIILIIAIGMIGFKYSTTGEFLNKGVSLKGGTTFTITDEEISINELEFKLFSEFLNQDVSIRKLTEGSNQIGVIIETDSVDVETINQYINILTNDFNLDKNDYTVETMGSSLGNSFFKQTFRALILAFIFMALVVFFYFKSFIPSVAVVLAAFSDIIVTLAIVNLMGLKLTTAGIAAFLMLIGYSVDTDILLTTKILKSKDGSVFTNTISAMKTGLTMTGTTIVAVTVALIIAESPVINQIMTILLIGLVVDLIYTWFQNAAILRWYVEKNEKN